MTTSGVADAVFAGDHLDLRALGEVVPMARRLVRADAAALVRVQARDGVVSGYATTLAGALVGRRVRGATPTEVDITVGAGELVEWLADGGPTSARSPVASAPPTRHDNAWRSALPPARGWVELDSVPGAVITQLVAQGAAAHRDADRLGLGARAAQEMLDVPVLTVSPNAAGSPTAAGAPGAPARITNRSLSALTSMGFLAPDGHANVAVVGNWTRIAGAFGSVYAQDKRAGLRLL